MVRLRDGGELRGRAVVVATGARYRRLGLPDQERFEGTGIYYAATELESYVSRGTRWWWLAAATRLVKRPCSSPAIPVVCS